MAFKSISEIPGIKILNIGEGEFPLEEYDDSGILRAVRRFGTDDERKKYMALNFASGSKMKIPKI